MKFEVSRKSVVIMGIVLLILIVWIVVGYIYLPGGMHG